MSATEAEEEQARQVKRDRLADLADPDCERCEGSGLDPDTFTTTRRADGQTVYHLTEPCDYCIDDDPAASSPTA